MLSTASNTSPFAGGVAHLLHDKKPPRRPSSPPAQEARTTRVPARQCGSCKPRNEGLRTKGTCTSMWLEGNVKARDNRASPSDPPRTADTAERSPPSPAAPRRSPRSYLGEVEARPRRVPSGRCSRRGEAGPASMTGCGGSRGAVRSSRC